MNNEFIIVSNESVLNSVIRKALNKLGSSSVNFSISKLPVSELGKTVYRNKIPYLVFNSLLVGESSKIVNNIVCHELAHFKCGFNNKHNNYWSKTANSYSKILNCGLVTEIVCNSEIDLSLNFYINNFKYVYQCKKCGKFIGFNNPEYANLENSSFYHKLCGGRWIKININRNKLINK